MTEAYHLSHKAWNKLMHALHGNGHGTTYVDNAYRDGVSIGRGLFATRFIAAGERTAIFGLGHYNLHAARAVARVRAVEHCEQLGLPADWAGLEAYKTFPALRRPRS